MRKLFFAPAAVFALVASTGGIAGGASPGPYVWRWTVTTARDGQRANDRAAEAAAAAADFRQNYERYSAIGVLENHR